MDCIGRFPSLFATPNHAGIEMLQASDARFEEIIMGSLPRLKKKDELHYRKGSTSDGLNCAYCQNFVNFEEFNKEVVLSLYGRCTLLGVKESVRYRVRKDYKCDAQVLDESKCYWLKWKTGEKTDDAKESVSMGHPGA